MGEWGGHRRRALAVDAPTRHGFPLRSALLALVVLAGVSVLSFPGASGAGPSAPGLQASVLTPDGNDGYSIQGSRDTLTVSANPGNVSGNLRVLVWPADAQPVRDGSSCATWSFASSDLVQQGVALRIAPGPEGRVHAVTVTKNVYAGGAWIFNVHVWSGEGVGREIAAFDLRRVFRMGTRELRPRPLPWRICARTVGDRLDVLVWPTADRAPAWGDPDHGGSVTLPTGVARAGASGWFVGHLRPGMSAVYTDLHGGAPEAPTGGRQATGATVGGLGLTATG
ncbi:MAG: hypothetical protein ACXVJ7_05830 [Acidimicrobiia bacterium]